ncbi:type I restriction enzyme M protein [Christiangramia gaetbulicola]|uniref:Type I restriction enzyme M protein n=1 Tax=Christiangramia gaetbulicola TaxID=703340 RepID=A0A2T6AIF4_9FLAO|nr:N-6 DNA methylase [Christiangramia gaetbulicola]PTX43586.1 type I restriction enzyme M protein [Christiangramia gaetbulicola]
MNKNLGQYYTNDLVSHLLVSKINVENPQKILELGAGNGSLINAAINRWNNTEIYGGDIDKKNITFLSEKFPEIKAIKLNGLSCKFNEKFNLKVGTIDIGICNPPYKVITKKKYYDEILRAANLGCMLDYKILTSDLIFLAQNLVMLRDEGELGIILPDGLMTSQNFISFRAKLVSNYQIKNIVELPAKSFSNTEAKAHILIIKKTQPLNKWIELSISNIEGEIENTITIDKKIAINRMDYNHHSLKALLTDSNKKIGDFEVKIFRGNLSKKQLVDSGVKFIHTSDFDENFKKLSLRKYSFSKLNSKKAEKGDILIARVGRSCVGKIIEVQKGLIPVSDCVFVVRPNTEEIRKLLLKNLKNPEAKNWFEAYKKGVCARVLSKSDLLTFPINLK